jgi:hypothetical protein
MINADQHTSKHIRKIINSSIPSSANTKFSSLDISNIHSNIPVIETKTILSEIIDENMLNTNINHERLT